MHPNHPSDSHAPGTTTRHTRPPGTVRAVASTRHLPIAGLSGGFERLYAAYQQIVAHFSADEQDRLFRGTAAAWFEASRP